MKALNRAIARTVSQLGRYGREGCHPPMLMALETHLDALLTMERKQLEVAGISIARVGDKSVVNITSAGCAGRADGKAVADWILRELERTQAPKGMVAISTPQEKRGSLFNWLSTGQAGDFADTSPFASKPAPDWTPERVEQFNRMEPEQLAAVGDWLEYTGLVTTNFTPRKLYEVTGTRGSLAIISDDKGNYHAANMLDPSIAFVNRGRTGPGKWSPEQDSASAEACCGKYETCQKACVGRGIHIGRKQVLEEQAITPAQDVINMTDPRNWQAGDVVLRRAEWIHFRANAEYTVSGNDGKTLCIRGEDDTIVSYPLDTKYAEPASRFFTWLRHGEAQA